MLLASEGGTLGFAFRLGSSLPETGAAMAADAAGNVYVAGLSGGTLDFDPGTGTANRSGDAFAAKYSATGSLVWARTITGDIHDEGADIFVDDGGNVYLTGGFQGKIDFDPGAGVSYLNSGPQPAAFVLKLDAGGNFVWARSFSGGKAGGLGVAVDGSGNVYTTGFFATTVDFDPGPVAQPMGSAGLYDAYVSKLDSSGNYVWSRRMGGAYPTNYPEEAVDWGYDIGVDADGNVYTTGVFRGHIDFDPGPGEYFLTSSGNVGGDYYNDAFVWKLDTAGDFVWARRLGGPAEGRGIAVDAQRNVYTAGVFYGTDADFDPGDGVYRVKASGEKTVYVSKLSPTGDFLWAGGLAGVPVNPFTESQVSLGLDRLDSQGSVYIAGTFRGTTNFDPGAGRLDRTSAGGTDVFVVRLDAQTGGLVWADTMGGPSDDQGLALAVGPATNVYTTGSFRGTADFDPSDGTRKLTSAGGDDAFVSKLVYQTVPPGGWLQFSADTFSVSEAGSQATITVTRTGSTQGEVSVDYAANNGTATAGSDFTGVAERLVFADGVATLTFTVPILDDDDAEVPETIALTLTNPTGGAELGAPGAAVLTITDDEITYGPGRFQDGDGDTYVVALTGPGTVRIRPDDPDGDQRGPIKAILLEGTSAASSLTISVTKAAAGDGRVSIGKIVSVAGSTGNGSLKSLLAGKCDILESGPFEEGVALAGSIGSLTAGSIRATSIRALAIGTLATTSGPLEADITVDRAVQAISVRGGGASGTWSAARFGTITISGGSFNGELISTAIAASLGTTPAIAKLSVTGDFQGIVHALGKVGTVIVGRSILPNVASQSVVAAASIGIFRVARDLTDAVVLAGANLGADHRLGGIGENTDGFGRGSIGEFTVGGKAQNAIVGAGLDPVGMVFRNGNDAIVGGVNSRIGIFSITGAAGPENYFRAGWWPTSVKVGGVAVNPRKDARFHDLQAFTEVGTTDEQGNVTLRIAGQESSFQFLDDSSGQPIPGLVVGVSTGTGMEGIAVLEAFDPTKQYPPRFIVLHGPEAPAAQAQAARLTAESNGVQAAEPPIAIKINETAGEAVGKASQVATVVEAYQVAALPSPTPNLKGVADTGGVLEAFGYLAKAADTISGGLVAKAIGTLAPSLVQPISNQDAMARIRQKAQDATVENVAIVGLMAGMGNLPGVAAGGLSIAGTQLYKLVDENTVMNTPEGHLVMVNLGFTEIYAASDTPVSDPGSFAPMSITVTPDQVSPGGLGHLMLISKDRLGDGQVVPLDTNGRADIPVPIGDYALVYQQQIAQPVNQDVTVSGGGTQATLNAPPAPQVAGVTLTATPAITGLLDPGTQIQFSAVGRDAQGNIVPLDPSQLRFRVFNPQGSSVATIDPATGMLTIGPDQGAVRVVAEYGNVRSNLILASGLGPAFNLPIVLIEDASVVEGHSGTKYAVFNLRLSKPSAKAVTVDYNTAYLGSATTGTDYKDITGRLTFAANQTTAQIRVPVVGDRKHETNEQFALGLSNPVNARLDLKNSARGTIVDDDNPAIVVSPKSGLVTTEGGGTAAFTVKLGTQPTADVTVTLASSDTTEGTVLPTTLTFTPTNWNTARTVTVKGVNDSLIDGNQSYQVNVTGIVSEDPDYADPGLARPTVSCVNRDNDTLGPGKVSVTVVGGGYVVDNKGQIDTRIGDNLAAYAPDTFPILTAYDSAGNLAWLADWVPEGTSGANCFLINSDYANGLALTVYINGQFSTTASLGVSAASSPTQGTEEYALAGLLASQSSNGVSAEILTPGRRRVLRPAAVDAILAEGL